MWLKGHTAKIRKIRGYQFDNKNSRFIAKSISTVLFSSI